MNQADLRRMAEERILDAKALLDRKRWNFAYYAAGYAVECALKSCVLARMIYTGWVFREKVKVEECRTHDFGELVKLAGLTAELNERLGQGREANRAFIQNWGVVTQWRVDTRYEERLPAEAKALYKAITHDPDGVLPWIQNYW